MKGTAGPATHVAGTGNGSAQRAKDVQVELMGHLIYYFPESMRSGARVRTTVPSGTAVGHLSDLLKIPPQEIQVFLVNGLSVRELSTVLQPRDQVVILPVISGG